jgi:hypothetical protein
MRPGTPKKLAEFRQRDEPKNLRCDFPYLRFADFKKVCLPTYVLEVTYTKRLGRTKGVGCIHGTSTYQHAAHCNLYELTQSPNL